jgi:hypothetical protein
MTGTGISVEREVSEATALKIMEIALDDETDYNNPGVTVTLSGEGMEFSRDVDETTGVEVMDVAVHEGRQSVTDAEEGDDEGFPDDFFDRLSKKQRIMLEILLEADGEWLRGIDIRRQMREEYGLDVGEGGRATAGVIAGLTRKYDEEFRRDVIPGRWADETQQHAEFKIGDKYKDEIREEFEEQ